MSARDNQNGDLEPRPVRGRSAKQSRSELRKAAVTEGVISGLANPGVAGLTHRLVARRSGASLAATTYYFAAKRDMIAEASNTMLSGYLADFARAAASVRGGGPDGFRGFVARLTGNGMGRHRERTLAWCELILDGARDEDARALVRTWFVQLEQVWGEIARAYGVPDASAAARSGIDMTVGALFHGLALGLEPHEMAGAFGGDGTLSARLQRLAQQSATADRGASVKGARTRAQILEAAIALLAERGAAGVTYRAVARRAGLSPAAAGYYFASSGALLSEAQRALFARSKARYREVMLSAVPGLDLPGMAELSGMIFQREVLAHARMNLATYAIWLQAARNPGLWPMVQEALGDLCRAWRRRLESLGAAAAGPEPLLVQYLFVGSLIRALASGASAENIDAIRESLTADLGALAAGRHWAVEPATA